MFLKLNQTLGASYEADQDDVRTMKTALAEVGEYTPPKGRINGWTDDAMFDGMNRSQKKTGLRVDGVARPGGPTETNLNSVLSTAANTDLKPTGRNQDPTAQSNFGTPKVFDVSAVIGPGQVNTGRDVQGAKHTLAWAGYYPKDKARAATGEIDEDLAWGLLDFQRDHGLKQDGLMLPGGESATTLDNLAAPLVRATFGAEGQPSRGAQPPNAQEAEEPTEPPPEDGDDGGDSDGTGKPDNDHDRKCDAFQERIREHWREETKWMDTMTLLAKDIADIRSRRERNKYINLVEELTDYVHRPSIRDRMRDGDLPGLSTLDPESSFRLWKPTPRLRGPKQPPTLPGKGQVEPVPDRKDPEPKPGPAPAPPGGSGPPPPVTTAPEPDRDIPEKRDRDPDDDFLDWFFEPRWFKEIRKYMARAQPAAAKKATEANKKRWAVIDDAHEADCFPDQTPQL